MLCVRMSSSGEGATKYFDAALATGDYYVKEPGCGRWGGKGAERLSLSGAVGREDFIALVSNEMPGVPGKKLTVRTKEKRTAG